jgi:hypothetical protein
MLRVIDIDGKSFEIDADGFIKKFNPEWVAEHWGL